MFYYDVLYGQGEEQLPRDICDHLGQCPHCQGEMGRLKAELDSLTVDSPEQNSAPSPLTQYLRLHFAYVGHDLTCSTVKPFMPVLAMPGMEITVPTPITAHIDNCPACRSDLESIAQLQLTPRQLCRLARLLATDATESSLEGSQLQQDCPADLFDYVFPYSLDPMETSWTRFPQSLTSHLRSCPSYIEKRQELHRAVYAIRHRGDSGITTCFRVAKASETTSLKEANSICHNGTVDVQVVDHNAAEHGESEQPAPVLLASRRVPTESTSIRAPYRLKFFARPVAAAAAIIMVAVFLFNTPAAKAISFKEMFEALARATNVCVSRFYPGQADPATIRWVSVSHGITMRRDRKGLRLWDYGNRVLKTKPLSDGDVVTEMLSAEVAAKEEAALKQFVGLLPFSDPARLPPDALWQRVVDQDITTIVPGTEVYDLIWSPKQGWLRKWRYFVDPQTHLPKRLEAYEKSPIDRDYILRTVKVATYPADSEMVNMVNEIFK